MQGFGGVGGTAPPSPYGPSATVPPRPDNIHIFRRCLRAELNRLSPQAPRKHRKKGRMGFSPCGRWNMKNEILEEVWRNRDAFARKYNYDLDAMVSALQEMERRHPEKVVDRRDVATRERNRRLPRGTSEL